MATSKYQGSWVRCVEDGCVLSDPSNPELQSAFAEALGTIAVGDVRRIRVAQREIGDSRLYAEKSHRSRDGIRGRLLELGL
jgi:hypothetical protein